MFFIRIQVPNGNRKMLSDKVRISFGHLQYPEILWGSCVVPEVLIHGKPETIKIMVLSSCVRIAQSIQGLGCALHDRVIGVRLPARPRDFSFLHSV